MDELASELGIDPVELRLHNITDVDPHTGHPWSSSGLRECLERGAARFGWAERSPQPRSRREGNWLIGPGVAPPGGPGHACTPTAPPSWPPPPRSSVPEW